MSDNERVTGENIGDCSVLQVGVDYAVYYDVYYDVHYAVYCAVLMLLCIHVASPRGTGGWTST